MNREGLIGWLIEHPKTEWGKSYLPGGWEWFEIAAGEVVARKTGHVFVKLDDFMKAESERVATRAEVIQWCVDVMKEWPVGHPAFTPPSPNGWKWSCSNNAWTLCCTDHTELNISASDFAKAMFEQRYTPRDEVIQWCVDTFENWPIGAESYRPEPPRGWKWESAATIDGIEWKLFGTGDVKPIVGLTFAYACLTYEPTCDSRSRYHVVKSPKHYAVVDDVEAITIIASSLTTEEWRGYCLGNIMKYRLRAGKKDELTQDIAKADEYRLLFERYKHLNRQSRAKNNERLVQEKA